MSELRTLPVLPLRDIVVFPHMVVPLFVGRDKSVRALEEVMRGDKQILLVTQKNSADDDPAPGDIFDARFADALSTELFRCGREDAIADQIRHRFGGRWLDAVQVS